MQVYISAIQEGFIYGLLALGIYISLKILDIPDLTTEGSFGFGAAVELSRRILCRCNRRYSYCAFADKNKGAPGTCRHYYNERPLFNQSPCQRRA